MHVVRELISGERHKDWAKSQAAEAIFTFATLDSQYRSICSFALWDITFLKMHDYPSASVLEALFRTSKLARLSLPGMAFRNY